MAGHQFIEVYVTLTRINQSFHQNWLRKTMILAITFFICTTKVTLGFYLSRHFCTLQAYSQYPLPPSRRVPEWSGSIFSIHGNQGGSITSAVTVLRWTPELSPWGRGGGNLEPPVNGWGTTESHTVRTHNPPRFHCNALLSKQQHPEVYILVHSPEKHLSLSRKKITI